MTIDEAIIHCENEVWKNSREADRCFGHGGSAYEERAKSCKACAEEHRQLAEWLKLLKRILESGDCNDCALQNSQCRYAPGWGEQVRYNCPFYSKERRTR